MSEILLLFVLCLSPLLLTGENAISFSMEDEYTPNYCQELETAYGYGMMSEGGQEGIDHMFKGIQLTNKKALDIGSGLGGVAFYLAEKHEAKVVGLEVNPWMVEESNRRTPSHLVDNVSFILTKSNSCWPFKANHFDLIYSKEVLIHLETKDEIFQECWRILNQEGLLVITDWLSSDQKQWGENIKKLVELENLILFPESEKGYIDCLTRNGFELISVRDDSLSYLRYNLSIVENLKIACQQGPLNHPERSAIEASILGYQSIAKAIEVGELRVLRFLAKKK